MSLEEGHGIIGRCIVRHKNLGVLPLAGGKEARQELL